MMSNSADLVRWSVRGRIVTVLARGPVSPGLLDALGVLRETRGANVWLAAPTDDAVSWDVWTGLAWSARILYRCTWI